MGGEEVPDALAATGSDEEGDDTVSSTPAPSFRAATTTASSDKTRLFRRKSDPSMLVVMRGNKTYDVPENFMSLAQTNPTAAFDKIAMIKH
jgi:hypothetical protein